MEEQVESYFSLKEEEDEDTFFSPESEDTETTFLTEGEEDYEQDMEDKEVAGYFSHQDNNISHEDMCLEMSVSHDAHFNGGQVNQEFDYHRRPYSENPEYVSFPTLPSIAPSSNTFVPSFPVLSVDDIKEILPDDEDMLMTHV